MTGRPSHYVSATHDQYDSSTKGISNLIQQASERGCRSEVHTMRGDHWPSPRPDDEPRPAEDCDQPCPHQGHPDSTNCDLARRPQHYKAHHYADGTRHNGEKGMRGIPMQGRCPGCVKSEYGFYERDERT